MPNTIEYSDSPNVDTAFVVREDGKKNRAVLTAPQDTSTLEYPVNPNSTKGYITINGKKQRVVLTVDASGNGGSIDEDKVIVLSDTIPTADADSLGKFYCYKGQTNATYTHGYVYECVEGSPIYTGTVSFEAATLSGTVVTCDGDNFANFLTENGAIPTSIVSGTMTYDAGANGWRLVGKDAEDTTVTTFMEYTEDYEDHGFTFTGTPVDGDVVAFTCTVESSSTYSWERIDLQPAAKLGRYLSSWDCSTGLAMTNPPSSPYEYTAGDYYIVGVVATGGANNYKPSGSSYTSGVASTTVETGTVEINDTYLFDGTNWTLLKTSATLGGESLAQYETMPTATAANVGEIAQFVGATDTYENGYIYKSTQHQAVGTATISQTTGNTLSNLAVDAATFETQQHTTGSYAFSATEIPASIDLTLENGWDITLDLNSVIQELDNQDYGYILDNGVIRGDIAYDSGTTTFYFSATDIYENVATIVVTSYVTVNTEGNSNIVGRFTTMTRSHIEWTYNNNVVDLADYGITYSGTPTDGDVITVVYTAGAISYTWERIDVQPSGINWTGIIDWPANYTSGQGDYAKPVWVLNGGIPDGTYEFYFQTLITDNRINDNTVRSGNDMVTYKVVFGIYTDSDQRKHVQGRMFYIIDGEWQLSGYYAQDYYPSDTTIGYWMRENGDDLIIYTPNVPFISRIIDGYQYDVDGIFKISNLKNLDTGTEYTPVGHLYQYQEDENWGYINDCSLQCGALVKIPEQKEYGYPVTYSYDGSYQYMHLMEEQAGAIGVSTDWAPLMAELDVSITSSMGGEFHVIIENTYGSYTAKALKATGDLANAEILANPAGVAMVHLNISTNDSRNLYCMVGAKGSTLLQSASIGWYYDTPDSGFQPITLHTVGADITLGNLGSVIQYNEEMPNVAYTNGHFYKADGTLVNVPSSMICTETSSTGTTITCPDPDAFVTYMAGVTGWSEDSVKQNLQNFDYFSFDPTSNYWYWSVGVSGYDANFATYFTFSPALSTDTVGWNVAFTPAHQEIQNPGWVEYEVQKGVTTPTTMPTLTVANWSSNTQTVTVNGVTANNAILVGPAPSSAADWASAGILCTAQATDSLTFTCQTVPTNDITVNVCLLN